MNQRQQNLRYAAARAFMESLDQLQETLQASETQPVVTPEPQQGTQRPETSSPADPSFDLQSFEQAVADIEAFIQKRHGDESEQ
ncbi:MAG: hypothetical protein ACAF41_08205 [Leptolyngbya sp. BL-A-14]